MPVQILRRETIGGHSSTCELLVALLCRGYLTSGFSWEIIPTFLVQCQQGQILEIREVAEPKPPWHFLIDKGGMEAPDIH